MMKYNTIGEFTYPFLEINKRENPSIFPHKGFGYVVYEPQRGKMKTNVDWWCILNISEDISRYYRFWIYKKFGIQLYKPSWGAHISLVRGVEPPNKNYWKKYTGEKVYFEYSHWVRGSKDLQFWNVEVKSSRIEKIITELGITTHPNLHITIGRLHP